MRKTTNERGFTLVEVVVVLALTAVLAVLTAPNLIEARKNANESSAIAALKAIATAQSMFRLEDPEGDGNQDFATSLGELGRASLVDSNLAKGTSNGYGFTIVSATPFEWQARAEPLIPGRLGGRYFFVDESGVIRFNTTGPAGPTDPDVGGGAGS
jgi:prepilin-type N-terminal cleavage/methylation domain-containing protein